MVRIVELAEADDPRLTLDALKFIVETGNESWRFKNRA